MLKIKDLKDCKVMKRREMAQCTGGYGWPSMFGSVPPNGAKPTDYGVPPNGAKPTDYGVAPTRPPRYDSSFYQQFTRAL